MATLTSWASFFGQSARDPEMIKRIYLTARERLHSQEASAGLRRDLQVPHEAPRAALDISVRPIEARDVPHILAPDGASSPAEKWDRARRLRLLDNGAGSCFVAVTSEDIPCYLQWMFSARDNAFVQQYFAGGFPRLDDDTALLEDAFTPTAFRGQRIMSAAMALIAERATDVGARYVITFVGFDNVASLKGCARAGFAQYTTRTQRWRSFRQTTDFAPA